VSNHQETITEIYQEQNTITKDEEFDCKDTLAEVLFFLVIHQM
jgi:hypothetical protein